MQVNREKIEPILWGAAGGAVVLAIVGFTWVGWVTGSTAQQMAADAAEEAVVDRLASICVGQYNRDPEKDQKLENMKAIISWKRGDYVKELGWSTMPGEKDPDSAVSRTCADLLSEISG